MLRRRIISGATPCGRPAPRRWYTRYQRAGMAREVKTRTNQRERREGRRAIREGRYDTL